MTDWRLAPSCFISANINSRFKDPTTGCIMTRPSTPPILSELRNSSSPASQVAALRALKNEIIGHEQKKEMWIGLGVLDPLVRILNSHKASGKRRYREGHGSANQPKRRGSRTDEEEAHLQAIIILGSLAHGEWKGKKGRGIVCFRERLSDHVMENI